nr:hypothetical protein [Tanacetum cinerariifolium]
MDEEEINKLNDLNKDIIEEVTSKISCDAVMEKVADLDTVMEEVTEGITIPVEVTYYDTIDEALDMYTKYAEMDGFEIKKGEERLTKSGAVQHNYSSGISCDSSGISCDSSGILLNLLRFYFNLMRFHLNLMYNMKFVPFIGIDNHGKCVTLGSRMLLHKDTKSYAWLLNAFMTAFSHEPTMIVTDQDGTMKRAIEVVFKKAKHRLCMWHIIQKIPSKTVSHEINVESHEIQSESHKIRQDVMTTSRSESENSFFKSFTSLGATLVSFMMSYESAMEKKRYRQEALDFKTIEAAPKCETKLAIKLHAARVYTRTIFLLVQMEINEDDSLFLLSKDGGKMDAYVEKLKILLDEVKADMPNPPSRNTGDVIGGIFSITKPNQIAVQNPTKAVNKGEHLKKGQRLKSEREKELELKDHVVGLLYLHNEWNEVEVQESEGDDDDEDGDDDENRDDDGGNVNNDVNGDSEDVNEGLDRYSQFVWVYPLINKSDVLSKFMLFRNCVHTQFKFEIKLFLCDHGGEFDNHNLQNLLPQMEFWFSCPKTSQKMESLKE